MTDQLNDFFKWDCEAIFDEDNNPLPATCELDEVFARDESIGVKVYAGFQRLASNQIQCQVYERDRNGVT